MPEAGDERPELGRKGIEWSDGPWTLHGRPESFRGHRKSTTVSGQLLRHAACGMQHSSTSQVSELMSRRIGVTAHCVLEAEPTGFLVRHLVAPHDPEKHAKAERVVLCKVIGLHFLSQQRYASSILRAGR